MSALKQAPCATWGAVDTNHVREVYYENVPYGGQLTRVFGYYAVPTNAPGPYPALVLVHGAGQTAYSEWALHWANRGYVALAMDLNGYDANGRRRPDGGPPYGVAGLFPSCDDEHVGDTWVYHAVAAVVRAISLVAVQPEVDVTRIGVHGISMGGVLTSIVAGLDDRLKVAVPVFGAGYLYEDSGLWDYYLDWVGCGARRRWTEEFDAARYLPGARCSMLFMSGATDPFFPPNTFQHSFETAAGPVTVSMRPRVDHGCIWAMPWTEIEVTRFLEATLHNGVPLATLGVLRRDGDQVSASYNSPWPVAMAELWYTTDIGPWTNRSWRVRSANISTSTITAPLPVERPLAYYLAITDTGNAFVSTPYAVADTERGLVLRFTQTTSGASRGFEMKGTKPPGHRARLQATVDRCTWSSLATNTNSGTTFTFAVTNAPSPGFTIFRLRDLDW